MSVNMFGLALTIEAHIRSKNGHPHQNTTGVARISAIQFTRAAPSHAVTDPSLTISAIVTTNTGAPKTTASQNRRVIATSSGFASETSAGEARIGSSAMPHFGQAPGRSVTTSGCIGHVNLVRGCGGAG